MTEPVAPDDTKIGGKMSDMGSSPNLSPVVSPLPIAGQSMAAAPHEKRLDLSNKLK
jgi:hypothetical protein